MQARHFFSFILLFFSGLVADAGDFVKTNDGIIVHPDAAFSGNAKEVQLRVINENIIRVSATADKSISPNKSLIIAGIVQSNTKWNVTSTKNTVSLKTVKLIATVDLQSGAVIF